MMHLIQKRFCVQILMQSFHTGRKISASGAIKQVIPCRSLVSEYARLSLPKYWKSHVWLHAQSTQVLAFTNFKRPISDYSDSHQGEQSSRNTDIATHHVGKLTLNFDEEEDLRKLLESARILLDTDDFKLVKTDHAKDKIEHLVKYLCYCQCSPDNILKMLEGNPQILTPSWSSLQQIIMLLEEIGFGRGQLLKVLDGHKALWESNIAMLRKRLGQLRQLGFSDDQRSLKQIVAKWPQILTIHNKQMHQSIEELKRCDFSRGEIQTIIADHPQVLIDSAGDIALKYQYVLFCMGITDGKDLVHGKIFKYSLDHIRTRHILLERMGIYRTPDKRRSRKKNLRLAMITDTPDRRFCEKVAGGISQGDFQIFRQNLKDELEEMGLQSRDSEAAAAADDIDSDYDSDVLSEDDNGYESDESNEYSDSDEDNPERGYRR